MVLPVRALMALGLVGCVNASAAPMEPGCEPWLANTNEGAPFHVECPTENASFPLAPVFCGAPKLHVALEGDVHATGTGCYQSAPPSMGVYFYCCGALGEWKQ